jgi:8-oxo-dGTP pyrophosphatase MutT (NUDIX family)
MRLLPLRAACLVVASAVAGCNQTAPTCPDERKTPIAPSAGCFHLDGQSLLVVKQLNGKISIPGGNADARESARCTAHRETWEETGLNLQPAKLITVFDTGFHLFQCDRHIDSGEIDPPPRIEVRSAFYLPASEFDAVQWRYTEQAALFKRLVDEKASPP